MHELFRHSLNLRMRVERPRKTRGVVDAQEHLPADFTYWMRRCSNQFITWAWKDLCSSAWGDVTWRTAGQDAVREVQSYVRVAFHSSASQLSQGFEHVPDMPGFLQEVIKDPMNCDRFQNPHPNHRNIAQLGDAVLLMNLTAATNICKEQWGPTSQQWPSLRGASLPRRAAARGPQADLFDDWEFDELCTTNMGGHGKEALHRKSTVVETVIGELWLRVQDEAAVDEERTQCAAMLTIMTYHILWRRFEIELQHPEDLNHGLAMSFPICD